MKRLKNKTGQSLVEYLLLTALLGVATMGVVRLMGDTISGKFAQITDVIQGRNPTSVKVSGVSRDLYQERDMSDFMKNATNGHQ